MSKKRLFVSLLIVCILHQTGICQFKNGPTEDSLAPPIIVKESLDNNYQQGLFKNKFVVIDFWATWCAPCIAGFPHFNALANKFSGNKNILFATMTDEDRKKVELFFKRTKKELSGLRLLDDNAGTMNAFSIKSIPLTVVIDKEGIVKWKGTTEQLKEGLLDSITKSIPLIKNDKINIPVSPYIDPAARRFINKATFSILLIKSTDSTKEENASGSWGRMGDDFTSISYTRKPLLDFIGFLLGKNKEARFIVNDKQKADFKIDVFFSPGETPDSSYTSKYIPGKPNTNFLIHLLSQTFHFRFSQQNRVIKGYRLVTTDTVKLKDFETLHIKPKGVTHSSESDEINGIVEIANHSIADIVTTMENYLKFPIKNETGTDKHYDFTLNVKNIVEANKQLAKYGLALVETTNEPFETVYLDFY